MNNLLYFEYYENKKSGFDTECFIEKYHLDCENKEKTDMFSFLEEVLEPQERVRFCSWKETLKEKKIDVSTFLFNIKTMQGMLKLTITMVPIINERSQEIEYYVGYFS